MKNKLTSILISLLFLSVSGSVHAELLAEPINISMAAAAQEESISIWWGKYEIDWPDMFLLFEPLTLADIGSTQSVSSGQDFDAFTSLLTNGVDDWLSHGYSHGFHSTSESNWINPLVELQGPDFIGYRITDITLTVNDLIFTPAPWGDGTWLDCPFDVTYNFYGELVPEPTTLALLTLGSLMLRKRKA